MSVQAQKSVLIDANKNFAWIVDSKSPTEGRCIKIHMGRASHGGSDDAKLGNQFRSDGQGLTPPGMLVTFHKTDVKGPFRSFDDFIGLKGTNALNNLSENPRGILLHKCGGQRVTSGCVCFPSEVWPEIKKLIGGQNGENGTPVFIYANSMGQNDGCPDDKYGKGLNVAKEASTGR
jgi:hypothetical protein